MKKLMFYFTYAILIAVLISFSGNAQTIKTELKTLSRDAETDHSTSLAQFHLRSGSQEYSAVLTASVDLIADHYPYDEDEVLKRSVLADNSISMSHREDYTYIEQIVALTKKLHHAVYPDAPGKWLFTKIQMDSHIDPSSYRNETVTIRALKNFHNRLSQCMILVGKESVGHIYFSALSKGTIK